MCPGGDLTDPPCSLTGGDSCLPSFLLLLLALPTSKVKEESSTHELHICQLDSLKIQSRVLDGDSTYLLQKEG